MINYKQFISVQQCVYLCYFVLILQPRETEEDVNIKTIEEDGDSLSVLQQRDEEIVTLQMSKFVAMEMWNTADCKEILHRLENKQT